MIVFAIAIQMTIRSSHQSCSVRKGVLRNFAKFTWKYLRQVLFYNKVAGPEPGTLLKKRLWHICFPMNFAKFQRTPFHRTSLNDCFSTIQHFLAENPVFFCFWENVLFNFHVPCYVTCSCRKTFKQPFTDVLQNRCS